MFATATVENTKELSNQEPVKPITKVLEKPKQGQILRLTKQGQQSKEIPTKPWSNNGTKGG
eukprot:1007506-Ditylum_brightwellii.AAC.1